MFFGSGVSHLLPDSIGSLCGSGQSSRANQAQYQHGLWSSFLLLLVLLAATCSESCWEMNLVVLTEFSERRVRAGVGRGEKRQAVTLLFSQLAAVIVAMWNSVEFHVLSLSQLRTRTLCFLLGWNILFPVFNRGPLVPTYRKTKVFGVKSYVSDLLSQNPATWKRWLRSQIVQRVNWRFWLSWSHLLSVTLISPPTCWTDSDKYRLFLCLGSAGAAAGRGCGPVQRRTALHAGRESQVVSN